jgi:hypothetical protein
MALNKWLKRSATIPTLWKYQQPRRMEGGACEERGNQRQRLTAEGKMIFATAAFVLIGFSAEDAEYCCMNTVPCMGCFVIHVEGVRRKKTARKGARHREEACCVIPPTS